MLYRSSAAHLPPRAFRHRKLLPHTLTLTLLLLHGCVNAGATIARAQTQVQTYERTLDAAAQSLEVQIRNRLGRVTVVAEDERQRGVSVSARGQGAPLTERDVRTAVKSGVVTIEAERGRAAKASEPLGNRKFTGSLLALERERIDLVVRVPVRARVLVTTELGAVDIVGNVSSAEVKTDTGTIRADVPLTALRYNFRWTLARPRYFSELALPKVKEKRGGGYEIEGRFGEREAKKEERIALELETARGVILFGVSDESNVPADLRERELTESARAIIRSGDEDLISAIRKVAPRLVGEYAETLPPRREGPGFAARSAPRNVRVSVGQSLARLQASVTDRQGRAIENLSEKDFIVVENGEPRTIRDVTPSTAPFNLVLLLDVSGSVEERLDFIRKAALAFISTVNAQDRIAIISFRDDVQLISDFTTDRSLLTQRIKRIDAGGATALYDALAYSLVDTLKPLRGERTAIVVLSDGDDNKSFLPFSEILETVIESGALVYPLYVPSGLIPSGTASPTVTAAQAIDPMRSRYLALTSRADEEGRKLAEVSGGVYYPVTRIDQLQRAYDDVVKQLRTAYTITYESKMEETREARVRVRVAREGASVRLSPSIHVPASTAAP